MQLIHSGFITIALLLNLKSGDAFTTDFIVGDYFGYPKSFVFPHEFEISASVSVTHTGF